MTGIELREMLSPSRRPIPRPAPPPAKAKKPETFEAFRRRKMEGKTREEYVREMVAYCCGPNPHLSSNAGEVARRAGETWDAAHPSGA